MPNTSNLLSPKLLARLERMELVSRKIFRGRMKGERRSPRKGQSVEFADFRNYVPGDDLRFVDWNTYARLEKLFLKMFLEEEDLHFYALIDASDSMSFGEPTKLQYAAQLAASLGFVGLIRSDRVRIETLGQSAKQSAPVFRGRRSLWRMLEHVEGIEPGESISLVDGVRNFCLRNSGKGIVVLISDLMDKTGYEDALKYLVSRDMDVYVIHVLSAEELDPELQGDLRLIDCEDADVAEITVTGPLMKRYKQTLAAFVDRAREFCTRRGMAYLLARNEVPVEDLISGYLRHPGARSLMWPSFINTIAWWQWLILAAVPPAIVLLYFLKLKHRPVEVPSTYLWHRSIEDLHVNSIWQRLRRNLLLFLQLLLLLLAAMALLRPNWRGADLTGDRFIFLVDNSASMQATDLRPNRLDEAKRRVGELIDQMKSGDVGMIVSFADSARIVQTFTDNRRLLRRKLAEIKPTQRNSSLIEALKVASGLVNPGHAGEDFQFSEEMTAQLYIFSDGRFGDVSGFSLGNLRPTFVCLGEADSANIGIVAFSVRRSETNAELYQAFARLENFGLEDVNVGVELLLDGELIDADRLEVTAGESRGVAFDIGAIESGVLQLKLEGGDDLALDDEAHLVISPPRPADVLLITPGNEPLEFALQTDSTAEISRLTVESPAFLKDDLYHTAAAAGAYDLIIYDRVRPEIMPQSNTLSIGSLPPVEGWSAEEEVDVPQIIDVEASHPMMQWIDLADVVLAAGTPLRPPPGASVLIDTDAGPMMALAPRERFEDVVTGFRIIDEVTGEDGGAERYIGTNWMTRQSFPVFIFNVFHYLGGTRDALESGYVRVGRPVALQRPAAKGKLRVQTPSGKTSDVPVDDTGKAAFTATGELGVYRVLEGNKPQGQFAVNLLSAAESDVRPDEKPVLQIGHVEVAGQRTWQSARREAWKWLLLAALAVLLIEWYIYNRRVYL